MTEFFKELLTVEHLVPIFQKAIPRVIGILFVIIAGWILALVLKRAITKILTAFKFDTFLEKLAVPKLLYGIGIQTPPVEIVGRVVYFTVLVVALILVLDLAGLDIMAVTIPALFGFLPRVVAGIGIFLAGLFVADLLKGTTKKFATRSAIRSPELVAQFVYFATVIFAVLLGLEQLGFDLEFAQSLLLITGGALAVGVALSFALGAQHVFRGLVSKFYLEQILKPGDRVRADGKALGIFVQLASNVAVFEQDGEFVVVPCHMLTEQSFIFDRPSAEGHDSDDDSLR